MTTALVVGEDIPIRSFVEAVLGVEGYSVATVSTAKEAFEYLRTTPQRVVAVFDYSLPDADLERILHSLVSMGAPAHRHGYVILSAHGLPVGGQAEVAGLGIQMLSIPFSVDRLLEAVREAEQRIAAAN